MPSLPVSDVMSQTGCSGPKFPGTFVALGK
jgi:hypothetical protein